MGTFGRFFKRGAEGCVSNGQETSISDGLSGAGGDNLAERETLMPHWKEGEIAYLPQITSSLLGERLSFEETCSNERWVTS